MKIKDFALKNKKKIFAICILLLIIAFSVVLYFIVAKPLISFVNEPDRFKMWVQSHGILSHIAFVLMVIFQIIIAFVPGEPFELVAGYAFGPIMGTLLCVIGSVIGGVLVFMLTRKYGAPLVELFFEKEKIENLKFLKESRKRNIIMFLLFLIPGTPKDILSYFAGLTDIKITYWILICSVAKLPSIVTSTISGGALGSEKYITAIIFLLVTVAISLLGIWCYKLICKKLRKNKGQ